jgi:hypothetical protein
VRRLKFLRLERVSRSAIAAHVKRSNADLCRIESGRATLLIVN